MRVVCSAPGGYLEPQSRGVCQFALPTWPPVETLNLVREHDTDHRQSRRDRDLEGIALTLTGDWAHQCKADLRIVCSGGSTTARRLACSWSACGVREIQTTSPRPGTLERRPATSLSPRGSHINFVMESVFVTRERRSWGRSVGFAIGATMTFRYTTGERSGNACPGSVYKAAAPVWMARDVRSGLCVTPPDVQGGMGVRFRWGSFRGGVQMCGEWSLGRSCWGYWFRGSWGSSRWTPRQHVEPVSLPASPGWPTASMRRAWCRL